LEIINRLAFAAIFPSKTGTVFTERVVFLLARPEEGKTLV
jgi:hypothetical protein